MFILRKESRSNLYYAFICFSIAFYDAMCVGLYNSVSVESGVLWQRGQFAASAFIAGNFFFFVFSLYEKPSTGFKRLYLAILSAFLCLGFAFPRLVVSADAPNMRSFVVAGLSVAYFEGHAGIVFNLLNIWLVAGMAYVFKVAAPFILKREREDALYFLAGMSLFFISTFTDILIASNLVTFIYTAEYSFFVLIIMMDLAVQRNFVSLLREVESLNATLEDKVASRTAENTRLVSELSTKNAELQEKNAILADLADRDSLTRLLNHAAFHRRLSEEVNVSRRQLFPVGLVMIDIDFFKEINDTYGHQTGDKVILRVSEVLTHKSREYDSKARYATSGEPEPNIRLYDVPGRYGGDEFALLLPYCREAEVLIIAERIRKKIEEIEFPGFSKLRISASLGGAVFDPKNGEVLTAEDLMQLADRALYDAKAAGRGRTVIASKA
jgi:GGDEF domain-containing protein